MIGLAIAAIIGLAVFAPSSAHATVPLVLSNPCAAGSQAASSSISPPSLVGSGFGELDGSFDSTGFNYSGEFSSFANGSAGGYGLTRQGDGKLIVAGCADSGASFALARYNTNGTLDTSFDTDGKVTTQFGGGFAVAEAGVEMDGANIVAVGVAAGATEFAVARYLPNGSPDTSFGGGTGRATISFPGYSALRGDSMLVDAGKIVVAGYGLNGSTERDDWLLARFNSDGTPDTNFGEGGVQTTSWNTGAIANSIIKQGSDYLVGGSADGGRFAVARYLSSNGALDVSFDGDGKVTTEIGAGLAEGWSIRLDTSGRIIQAGTTDENTRLGLVAWKEFGTPGQWQPDPTFDVDGKVTTSFSDIGITSLEARSLGVQVSPALVTQRLIVAGFGQSEFGSAGILASYSPCDGSLEARGASPFGGNVKLRDILIEPNAKIAVAGEVQSPLGADGAFLVARINGRSESDTHGCPQETQPTSPSPGIFPLAPALTPSQVAVILGRPIQPDFGPTFPVAQPTVAGTGVTVVVSAPQGSVVIASVIAPLNTPEECYETRDGVRVPRVIALSSQDPNTFIYKTAILEHCEKDYWEPARKAALAGAGTASMADVGRSARTGSRILLLGRTVIRHTKRGRVTIKISYSRTGRGAAHALRHKHIAAGIWLAITPPAKKRVTELRLFTLR